MPRRGSQPISKRRPGTARSRRGVSKSVRGPVIAILGAGAVGTALAATLACGGRRVLLWSRSPARARAAARRAGVRAERELARAVADADLVLFCATDAGLAPLVTLVAELELPPAPRVALHTSGARGSDALKPLARSGFGIGALHPLVPVPPDAPEDVFTAAGFLVEARDPNVRAVATVLARELGGEAFELPTASRTRYHATATLISNGALALYSLALRELLPRALREEAAARAFATLLERTARNLRLRSPERALTGPVARGDVETLRRHLSELPSKLPAGRVYRELSIELTRLARADGRIELRTRRAIERMLR